MTLFFLFWTPILIYLTLPQVFFSIIYFFCILAMFIFSQVRKKLAIRLVSANLIVGVFIGGIFLISAREYLLVRISAFLNPDTAPDGEGYFYIFLSNVFSHAGWFGNGFKHDFISQSIPSQITDLAFPYLVYTFGWVFGIILCLILLTFILRISIHAFKAREKYGRLIVIGGTALFTLPTLWSILMGLGILPLTGAPIPIISYGNSMLIVYSAILGLILSVYRRKDIVEPTLVNK